MGESVGYPGTWNFHQVVWYDGKVYSACELLNETDPIQAVGMTLAEYKGYLFNPTGTYTTWIELPPTVIMTII